LSDPLAERRLGELLESVAERSPAPGGGSAAAIALALAAALLAMAARFSELQFERATETANLADALRERALRLADEDAKAYADLMAARRLGGDVSPAVREEALATAVAQAVAVPLEISELAAEVSRLATEVAAGGNPNLLGDALAAVLIAEAAAAAAATIVEINVAEEGTR
jgi:formiminotetrahydrofolate cyclodeaminase